ncbi:MAG: BON domain-containing protein [Rhodospirillales bacterium]|nr:BON domain-containing protein [Rhodospirillales bacterium]
MPTKFLSPKLVVPVLLSAALLLNGCAMLVGAGAGVGVAAVQERGIKGRASDLKIQGLVLKEFISSGIKMPAVIDVEVYEGRVLLTGSTTDTALADAAAKLAWKIEGVQDVINEIQFNDKASTANYSKDAWVTARLMAQLTVDGEILSVNYAIETVNGVVYLIGIAQSKKELERVIARASALEYVRRVVSHVRIKNPPLS